MRDTNVAVVSYEDVQFKETVGLFLTDNFQIKPVYLEVMTSESMRRNNLDIFLVNSDALNLKKEFAQNFRKVVTFMNAAMPKSIIMLTNDIKVSDFFRNAELAALETIDIGVNMTGLKVAVSNYLLKKQLSKMKRGEENGAKAMLE